MPLREERGVGKLLGTSCKEILRKRPSNFYWNCNFSLLFSLLTHFAFIFFAVWNVSLACEQSEKTHFFSLQSENENPHIFAYFRFKRIWAAHPSPGMSGWNGNIFSMNPGNDNQIFIFRIKRFFQYVLERKENPWSVF